MTEDFKIFDFQSLTLWRLLDFMILRTDISSSRSKSEVITEKSFSGVFSNNQPCQYFMERTESLANQRYRRLTTSYFFLFLMENSILQIFGSVDV